MPNEESLSMSVYVTTKSIWYYTGQILRKSIRKNDIHYILFLLKCCILITIIIYRLILNLFFTTHDCE